MTRIAQFETSIGGKLKGSLLKGSVDNRAHIDLPVPLPGPNPPPTLPTPFPFPSYSTGRPWPLGTRTPLRQLSPVKTTPQFCALIWGLSPRNLVRAKKFSALGARNCSRPTSDVKHAKIELTHFGLSKSILVLGRSSSPLTHSLKLCQRGVVGLGTSSLVPKHWARVPSAGGLVGEVAGCSCKSPPFTHQLFARRVVTCERKAALPSWPKLSQNNSLKQLFL